MQHSSNSKEQIVEIKPGIFAKIGSIKNIDIKLLERFEKALAKGMASKFYGQNGLKLINKSFWELKINADERLISKTLYKNAQGEYLISFDDAKKHSAVNKAFKHSKLDIVEVPSFKFQIESNAALVEIPQINAFCPEEEKKESYFFDYKKFEALKQGETVDVMGDLDY